MEHKEEVHEKVYKGTLEIFCGVEHRMKKRWRSSSTKKQSKDGDLQLTHQESPMSMQEVKIASTRREEFFVAVDSNLGAAIGKEEGAVESIPGSEGTIAQACEEECVFLCKFLALGRLLPDGSGGEAGESYQTPMVNRLRCKHRSKRF